MESSKDDNSNKPIISPAERTECIRWLTERLRGEWVLTKEQQIFDRASDGVEYRNGLLQLVNSRCKKVTPEEIKEAFEPVFDMIWSSIQDSQAFLHPVDPVKDLAEDYYKIITHPMDFSTARKGVYSTGWELIECVDLIFTNARIYNGPKSIITRAAQRLSTKFYLEADSAMRTLGYCCARKYQFNLRMLYCCTPLSCQIGGEADYYASGEHVCCVKCYNLAEESISVEKTQIPKEDFVLAKNNVRDPELWVECVECGRKVHQVCVLYHEELYPNEYSCCSTPTRFSAKNLPQTNLGAYLEERVNTFLRSESSGIDCGTIHVRVLSCSPKECEIKPRMKEILNVRLPFRAKTVFAFQVREGSELCFFSFHTQEYDSNCPEPNKRRVYLSYLDSVHFFHPKFLRSRVFHELLISYMDYVRKLGYAWMHIWACPPGDRDDYIFYCHPFDQKTPTAKRLIDWYKVMLNNAINQKAIRSYQDLFTCSSDNGITAPTQIPYMDGDFWTLRLEEDATHQDLLGTLEKHRNGFFVIELHSSRLNCHLTNISDPDPDLFCDLVDSRDAFLTFCRERNYEYSTLRRALYSTQAFVIELHKHFFTYLCHNCHIQIAHRRYHCNRCKDFDLCQQCHQTETHSHPLVEAPPHAPSQLRPEIDDFRANVAHTVFCYDPTCARILCIQYKEHLLPHHFTNACQTRSTCRLCKCLSRIYETHLSDCNNEHCGAKLCSVYKRRSMDLQDRKRMREQAQLRRRVQNMSDTKVFSNPLQRKVEVRPVILTPEQRSRLVGRPRQATDLIIPPAKRLSTCQFTQSHPNIITSPQHTPCSASRDFSIFAKFPNYEYPDLTDLENHIASEPDEAEREWIQNALSRIFKHDDF